MGGKSMITDTMEMTMMQVYKSGIYRVDRFLLG